MPQISFKKLIQFVQDHICLDSISRSGIIAYFAWEDFCVLTISLILANVIVFFMECCCSGFHLKIFHPF